MVEALKKFKFGWFGDGGLGERMIRAILSGGKTATSCPAYDPEDADLRPGDQLELTDKHGKPRAVLLVTEIEHRPFGAFDDALAAREGITLAELKEQAKFANGRELKADEEMRVIHFRLAEPGARP